MAHPDELDVRVTFSVKIDVAAWDQFYETGRNKVAVRRSVRELLEIEARGWLGDRAVLWEDRELAQS